MDFDAAAAGGGPRVSLENLPAMAMKGNTKSSADREKNGLVYLNLFLEWAAEKNGAVAMTWETMEQAEICDVVLWQTFCHWLKERPVSAATGTQLSISTAQDYFSGAVSYFKNTRFPKDDIWAGTGGITDQVPIWYSVLRQQLQVQAVREAQKRGEKIVVKSDEIGRRGMSKVVAWTLKNGSEEKQSFSVAVTTALMMAFNFASVGRVSECQTATFDSMRWSDGNDAAAAGTGGGPLRTPCAKHPCSTTPSVDGVVLLLLVVRAAAARVARRHRFFPRRPAPARVPVINPTCVVVVSLCRRPSTTLGRPRTPSVVDIFCCRAVPASFVAAARVERRSAVQPMVKSR